MILSRLWPFYCIVTGLLCFGCEKKTEKKFGVHDVPSFLEQCDRAAYASIFDTPRDDPFREAHLAWLKERHPEIFTYGIQHEELLSRELMLAAAIREKFVVDSDQSVVFIGASNESLPRLFHEVFGVRKIVIVDLKQCLEIAAKKIEFPVQWITPSRVREIGSANLVISTTTFSLLDEHWQKRLFDLLFSRAKGGAIFYSQVPRHWGVKSWKKEPFLRSLKTLFYVEQGFSKLLTDDTRSLILFIRGTRENSLFRSEMNSH